MGVSLSMEKRGYTYIDKIGKEIDQMIKEGKTQREIAAFFGFKDKTVIHQYLKRQRRKKERVMAGILPKQRGRLPKGYLPTEEEKDNEINRLKMEIQLLRSFLQIAGRR
jgi:hypothetical protein